jgi:polysaccharide biosynthesis protein PslG
MSGGRVLARRVVRVALTAAALCVGGAGTLGLTSGADSASADVASLKQKAGTKTAKAVKRKLLRDRTPGLAKHDLQIKVPSCKQRTKRGRLAGFRCRWNVKGELPGLVPVRCNGQARVNAKAKKAKPGRCKNKAELQAPLQRQPADILFGYFEDFSTIPDLFGYVGAGGGTVIREDIDWRLLQPTPGGDPSTWDWSTFDAVYGQAIAAGLRPVFTFHNAPCWAVPAPCAPNAPNPVAPDFVDEYAHAAAQIALRYPSSLAIEIWLEPNSARFWGAPADPAAFSALVGAAADAIHATGTGVGVYSGGLAPGSAAADKIEFGAFLSQALDAGGVQRADAIGFHAVTETPFTPGDQPTKGYLGRLRIQLQTMNTALADHQTSKPIVLTQLSYSSAPGFYTEAQQAEALVSSYEVARRIATVPLVIVSRLFDNGGGSKVQGFGVLRSDRAPKPAYCELAAARGVATPPGC